MFKTVADEETKSEDSAPVVVSAKGVKRWSNLDGGRFTAVKVTQDDNEKPKDDEEEKETSHRGADKEKSMQRQMEKAIMLGNTVLLEEVGEVIDPSLESIMTKSVFVEDNVMKI